MIKSLLLAITLLTISTSGWACLPPPAWASGASEIRKIMSSVAVILDTSGKNTNIRVDSLSVEGVQAMGSGNYRLLLKKEFRKPCSVDVQIEYVAIKKDPNLPQPPCGAVNEVAIKSIGQLTCEE